MSDKEVESRRSSAEADDLVDALPVNKTGSSVLIFGGVGVVALLALVFALSGGDDEAKKQSAAASEKAADAPQGMTKAELAERQEHLKRTQAALIAAANEEAEDEQKKSQETAAKQPDAQAGASPGPAPAKSTAAKAPAPKASPKNTKKSIDSLDSFGSDITSALK